MLNQGVTKAGTGNASNGANKNAIANLNAGSNDKHKNLGSNHTNGAAAVKTVLLPTARRTLRSLAGLPHTPSLTQALLSRRRTCSHILLARRRTNITASTQHKLKQGKRLSFGRFFYGELDAISRSTACVNAP